MRQKRKDGGTGGRRKVEHARAENIKGRRAKENDRREESSSNG